jgi:hypothetical protein
MFGSANVPVMTDDVRDGSLYAMLNQTSDKVYLCSHTDLISKVLILYCTVQHVYSFAKKKHVYCIVTSALVAAIQI